MTWVAGELYEMRWLLLGAAVVSGFALALQLLATSPAARGLVWPITTLAVVLGIMGAAFLASNLRRQRSWPAEIEANPAAFTITEAARADEFIAWYPRTRLIVAGLGLVAFGLMLYAEGQFGGSGKRPGLFGWGFALLLFCGLVFLVDHFSEERAVGYRAGIERLLSR